MQSRFLFDFRKKKVSFSVNTKKNFQSHGKNEEKKLPFASRLSNKKYVT